MATSIELGSMFVSFKARTDDLVKGMTQSKTAMSSADTVAQSSGKNISSSFAQAGASVVSFASKVVTGTDVARAKLTLMEAEVSKARDKVKELEGAADAGKSVKGLEEARAKLTLLEAAAQEARAKLQSFGSSAQNAGSSSQVFSSQVQSASSSLSGQFSGAIRGASSSLLDFTSKLTITVAGIGALVKGAGQLVGSFFAPNAALEQMTVSFDAFIEGGDQLNATMADIKKLAKESPFETPEINKAALSLLNMDVAAEDLTEQLGDIGAAVSKVGGSGEVFKDVTAIIAQMGVEGKITTGEMMQLQERNIPAFKILAKEMGVSVRQLKDMISSNDELIMGTDKVNFFMDALGRFGGDAMIAQSKTWNGMMSTIKDTVRDVWVEFSGPAFESAKGALSSFMGVLSSNEEGIMQFASGAGEKFAGVFEKIGQGLQFLKPVFDDLKIALTDEPFGVFLSTAGDVAGALGEAAGAAFDLWTAVSPLGGLFQETFDEQGHKLNGFAVAFYAAGDIMQNHVTPAIKDFTQFLRELQPVVEPIGRGIHEAFAEGGRWLIEQGPTLKSIGEQIFGGIGTVVKEVGPVITNELLPAFKDLGEAAGPLVSNFIQMVDKSQVVKIAFGLIGQSLKDFARGASLVVTGVTWIINAFNWWNDITTVSEKEQKDFWQNTQNTFGGIGQLFQDKFGEAKNVVQDAGKWIGEKWDEGSKKVMDASKWLYDHNHYVKAYIDKSTELTNEGTKKINEGWEFSKNWVSDRWKELSKLSAEQYGAISNTVGDKLAEAGGHWNNFWGGVGATINNAWDTYVAGPIGRFWGQITDTWQGWINGAWDWGANFISGFVSGMKSKIKEVRQAASNVAGAAASFLGFHSPTEEGPGSKADTWAPAFVSMYASGLEAGLPRIQSAIDKLAQPIGFNFSAPSAPTSYPRTSSGAESRVIHVHITLSPQETSLNIDGREFARAAGPALAYELRVVA